MGGSDYSPSRTRVGKFSVGTGSYPSTEGSTRFGNSADDVHIFSGSVYISGGLSFSGSLGLSGSTSLVGDFDVSGSTRFGHDQTKTHQITGSLLTTGSAIMSGTLDISGSTLFGYDLSKIHTFSGSINTTGSVVHVGNSWFEASGSSLLGSDSSNTHTFIGDSVTVTGSLNVSGSTYLSGSFLQVSGSTHFGDDQSQTHQFTGSISLTGSSVISGSLKVTGSLSSAGYTIFSTGQNYYYADGTNGSDSNDGLTSATPKQTLQAVFDLVPHAIYHDTVVSLSGTFSNNSLTQTSHWIKGGKYLYINGGQERTILDDNTGSHYVTQTDCTKIYISDTANANWQTDQYAGYWVEILTGASIGQIRLIQGNTTNTITASVGFSANIASGVEFRIVRPATTFVSYTTATPSTLSLSADGAGYLCLSNLYISGSKPYIMCYGGGAGSATYLMGIVSDSSASVALYHRYGYGFVFYNITGTPNIEVSPVTWDAARKASVSVRPGCTTALYAYYMPYLSIQGAYYGSSVELSNATFEYFGNGLRVRGRTRATQCDFRSYALGTLSPGTNAPTSFDNSSFAGLILSQSNVNCTAPFSASFNTTHGIVLAESHFTAGGIISGISNGGAGMYMFNNSSFMFPSGVAPIVSGNVGELSFDATTQKSTWAAIDGGAPAIDVATDILLCKENL